MKGLHDLRSLRLLLRMRTLSHFWDQATPWLADTMLDKTFQNKIISTHCLVPGMVTRSVEQAVRKVPWPSPLVTKYCTLWVAVKRKGKGRKAVIRHGLMCSKRILKCKLSADLELEKTSKTQKAFNRFDFEIQVSHFGHFGKVGKLS